MDHRDTIGASAGRPTPGITELPCGIVENASKKPCDPRQYQRNQLKQRLNISRRIIGITGITFASIYKDLGKN